MANIGLQTNIIIEFQLSFKFRGELDTKNVRERQRERERERDLIFFLID